MTITTISSRIFNQDIGKAKRAANDGPVFITDRGHPAHVLLTMSDYQKITKKQKNIVDLLSMPAEQTIKFNPAKLKKVFIKDMDL